ncbi:MAG TPA: hypothetical protein VK900_17810 [Anaerolineales bacterium]|nr:hypothetical protein [Anaerolineales bacterium]
MNDPELEMKGTRQRSNRRRWLAGAVVALLVLVSAGGYAWYYSQTSCDVRAVERASTRLLQQLDSFDHSYQFAVTASRRAIVRPVEELQQIFMDTQQVRVPACMAAPRDQLLDYMETVIRAFVAYGANEPDSTVRSLIDASDTHYDNFRRELRAVGECAPFCIP